MCFKSINTMERQLNPIIIITLSSWFSEYIDLLYINQLNLFYSLSQQDCCGIITHVGPPRRWQRSALLKFIMTEEFAICSLTEPQYGHFACLRNILMIQCEVNPPFPPVSNLQGYPVYPFTSPDPSDKVTCSGPKSIQIHTKV